MTANWLRNLADLHGLIPAKTSPVAPLCELVELLLPEDFPPTVDASEHVEIKGRAWHVALRSMRVFESDAIRECLVELPSGDRLFVHVLWDRGDRTMAYLADLGLTFIRFARSIDPVDAATLTAIRSTLAAATQGETV